MMRWLRLLPLAAAILLTGLPVARAEGLIASLSTQNVHIASNFVGAELTAFGTIERDVMTVSRPEPYQIAIAVIGPAEAATVRRKDRSLGIWVNRDERRYEQVPSFYRLVTTAASLGDLASATSRAQKRIGMAALLPQASNDTERAFATAFLRLKTRADLYAETVGTVAFLSPTLFKTTIDLPANVPVGRYQVRVLLFRGLVPLAETELAFDVAKSGFEQVVNDLAFQQPAAYGIATVILALFAGLVAATIFRRD